MYERMKIAKSIYEVLVELCYKNLRGNILTMMVASGIVE